MISFFPKVCLRFFTRVSPKVFLEVGLDHFWIMFENAGGVFPEGTLMGRMLGEVTGPVLPGKAQEWWITTRTPHHMSGDTLHQRSMITICDLRRSTVHTVKSSSISQTPTLCSHPAHPHKVKNNTSDTFSPRVPGIPTAPSAISALPDICSARINDNPSSCLPETHTQTQPLHG